MPSLQAGYAPNLSVYLKSLKNVPLESSIENLISFVPRHYPSCASNTDKISLLKRRQIRNSRPCAMATAHLLLRVVAKFRWAHIGQLLERIQQVGQRLIEAQPREMVVGNIVRRVLGMIRDEAKEDRAEDGSDTAPNSHMGSPRPEHSEPVLRLEVAPPTFSPLRNESTDASSGLVDDEANGDDVFGSKSQSSRPALLTYTNLTLC